MEDTYLLSSGLLIRQSISDCVRIALFATDIDDHPYWTPGGTLTLVYYKGRPYALTCRHIAKAANFDWAKLLVPHQRNSPFLSPVQAVHVPQEFWGHAVDTDLADLAIIKLGPSKLLDRFSDKLFVVDSSTIKPSSEGDQIVACGALYHETTITGIDVSTVYCELHVSDVGLAWSDGTLRRATTSFTDPTEVHGLAGLSGGAAYNLTKRGLAGIVSRGAIDGSSATIHFLDMTYVLPALEAVHNGTESASYKSRELSPSRR